MSTFQVRLKDFAKRRFGSVGAMADAMGIKQASLSHYISGRDEAGPKFWGRIRKAGITRAEEDFLRYGDQPEETDTINLPRFGQLFPLVSKISAGNGGNHVMEAIEMIPGPSDPKLKGAYYFEVQGDSMENRWEEGDLVLVHPGFRPAHGEYCIIGWNSEEAALKKIFYADGKMILHSLNPRYQPIIVDPNVSEVWFLGSVISTIHKSQRHLIKRIKKEE